MIKLEDIKSPEFLKSLSINELEELAEEIRQFIINNISKTGGHLSSNLGAIELTIALHYVFNSPHDKLIFDVGHQGYIHKILTGRANEFDKLRAKDGLSGFLKYQESPHDVWEAGHSSTSISAAAGFLEAKSMGADIGDVIAIIGDGSIQNGLALSAINYLGSKSNQKVIIVLNDNNMSISQNVGSLSKVFDKIRIRKSYSTIRKITPKFIKRVLKNAKGALSAYFHGTSLITSVGFRYFGPINGHNLGELISFLEYAKKSESSIIIHVKTIKGKGYIYAEEDNLGVWHGPGPFEISTGEIIKKVRDNETSWSNGIGSIILDEAKLNSKIKVITPAMVQGSGLNKFQEELPEQLIDVGIAEEHSAVMVSAMSRCNVLPVLSIYSTFMQRAYDQINHDIARTNSKVLFLVDRAGIVGNDGATHQGVFDISYLSALPNMVITMPKDLVEAKSLIKYALYEHNGPFVVRYPRGNTISDYSLAKEIKFASWEIVKPITEINIITYGPSVNEFEEIISKENKNIGLINARYIKPLDLETLKLLSNKTVIVVEEVMKIGSLASMINIVNTDNNLNIKIKSFGIDDIFVEQGNVNEVKKALGLDIRDVIKNI